MENLERLSWHKLFLEMCRLISQKSKDPSTKTGCVIVDKNNSVLSTGFNGFPRGVADLPERYHDRKLKYQMIAHCDANAIFAAARIGISLEGSTMYLTAPPCAECAKAIIQAGIKKVIWPVDNAFESNPEVMQRWKESLEIAELMAKEAGVNFHRYPGDFS